MSAKISKKRLREEFIIKANCNFIEKYQPSINPDFSTLCYFANKEEFQVFSRNIYYQRDYISSIDKLFRLFIVERNYLKRPEFAHYYDELRKVASNYSVSDHPVAIDIHISKINWFQVIKERSIWNDFVDFHFTYFRKFCINECAHNNRTIRNLRMKVLPRWRETEKSQHMTRQTEITDAMYSAFIYWKYQLQFDNGQKIKNIKPGKIIDLEDNTEHVFLYKTSNEVTCPLKHNFYFSENIIFPRFKSDLVELIIEHLPMITLNIIFDFL